MPSHIGTVSVLSLLSPFFDFYQGNYAELRVAHRHVRRGKRRGNALVRRRRDCPLGHARNTRRVVTITGHRVDDRSAIGRSTAAIMTASPGVNRPSATPNGWRTLRARLFHSEIVARTLGEG